MTRALTALRGFFLHLRPRAVFAAWLSMKKIERILTAFFVVVGIGGIVWLSIHAYLVKTISVPKTGGVLSEALIQPPHIINPVIADANETDNIIETLVFSGMLKSDGQGGVMPDLAESFEVKNNAAQYIVTLRRNLVWHDNQPLTTQDIAFTIDLMKNKELQNPMANLWSAVSVQVLSDQTIAFTLQKPYVFFPHYLTFKILPKHLWETIPANQFLLSDLNIKPVGSGPYQFKKLTMDAHNTIKQYTLVRFGHYGGPGPYIDTINLKFYPDAQSAEAALRKKEVASFADIPWNDIQPMRTQQNIDLHTPSVPSTVALFINTQADIVSDVNFRRALALGIDTAAIHSDVYRGEATMLDAPALISTTTQGLFDVARAQTILESLGWKDTNNNGIRDKKLAARTKLPTELSLSLIYLDTPDMRAIAEHITNNLRALGIDAQGAALRANEFTNRINNRSFQLALTSETTLTGTVPDLYPFWHSSQKAAPGLNISQYTNQEVDSIVEEMRKTTDPDRLAILRDGFQQRMRQDVPAIFIVQPQRAWAVESRFNIPPLSFMDTFAQRFDRINEWYIYTKRIWKQ